MLTRKKTLALLVALAAVVSAAGLICWLRGKKKPTAAIEVRTEGEHMHFDFGDGVLMKLVLIPAGKFVMGSPETEEGRDMHEGPRREVTITEPFYMGTTEVTQAQWKAVMGTEPWKEWKYSKENIDHAASGINWNDASAFCQKLSQLTGRAVRLPTEAEWEYACRAGSTTRFYYGEDPDCSRLREYAWYEDDAGPNDQEYAQAVGRKAPNAWGLHDMHGNVEEWCRDWYDPEFYVQQENVNPENTTRITGYRVLRGGSWWDTAPCYRSASRSADLPGFPHCRFGFRVVVSPGGMD